MKRFAMLVGLVALVVSLVTTPGVSQSGAKAPTILILGNSKIIVPRGASVGTQVDRVIRDVAWVGSQWDQRVPATRVPHSPDDLVPYMEGMLVGKLMKFADVKVIPLTPGVAHYSKLDRAWYGADAEGRYRFLIDPTKLPPQAIMAGVYDSVKMPDTHGFNAVAALAARAHPWVVVACMDLAAKADAALYLAERGINAYGPTDRYGYKLLGYRLRYPHAATVIGSAPIRQGPDGTAIIGGQPAEIRVDETIIVQSTEAQKYPGQYSDTPWRYFEELASRYFLPLRLVRVDVGAGELDALIGVAHLRKANVIAVRVGKSTSDAEAIKDGETVAAWLRESPKHRAVLFHSVAYAPGFDLFMKFPTQTTFGDLDPVLK